MKKQIKIIFGGSLLALWGMPLFITAGEKCPEVCPDGSRPYFCVCAGEETTRSKPVVREVPTAPPPQPLPKQERPSSPPPDTKPFAAPPQAKSGNGWRDPVTGMEFVWIAGGQFEMGCGPWTSKCDEDESPVHPVKLSDFWLGKYEVTQEQWQKVMGSNPSAHTDCPTCPVEQVSWEDAQNFIEKLNSQAKVRFRLPTEAEWEYACRSGGQEERYSGGHAPKGLGWTKTNSQEQSHPVGQKSANGLGLFDMTGNVWEWVEDWYAPFSPVAQTNPLIAKGESDRVSRGGSWYSTEADSRCGTRNAGSTTFSDPDHGFRLTREP
ncbi:MAG: formylglycine-generating enzyme family protein [Magnetococcales bacterium]|nr:formylglycine-generating enzyme family protein [Magnetococcales bacterium]NGZ27862.1 formylglycine-generating enzyme family protein [Magnetococcales bacterium]